MGATTLVKDMEKFLFTVVKTEHRIENKAKTSS